MGRVLNLKSEIQIMGYFHYYETQIKSKHGTGLLELREGTQFDKVRMIKSIEKRTKVKITKFEVSELSQFEFEHLYTMGKQQKLDSFLSSLS